MTPDNDGLLTLKLVRYEKKIRLEDESGQVRTYTVREMLGTDRDEYLNELTAKIGSEEARKKNPDYRGVLSILICRCLYDDANKLVPKAKIDQMPVSVQQHLLRMSQEVNGFDKDSEKNG